MNKKVERKLPTGDAIRKQVWSGGRGEQDCTHRDQIRDVSPSSSEGCEKCLATGDTWVHLRMCMSCGHVGCCNDSKNKHAAKHFQSSHHPIVKSLEPGEDWLWCYADNALLAQN
jgi:uncharacterized UBP type Zn finger protein